MYIVNTVIDYIYTSESLNVCICVLAILNNLSSFLFSLFIYFLFILFHASFFSFFFFFLLLFFLSFFFLLSGEGLRPRSFLLLLLLLKR